MSARSTSELVPTNTKDGKKICKTTSQILAGIELGMKRNPVLKYLVQDEHKIEPGSEEEELREKAARRGRRLAAPWARGLGSV